MKITEDLHMDIRLVDRNISSGVGSGAITREAYADHLTNLPDVTDKATLLEVEMSDVGVKNVEAKDTGEQE